MVQVLCVAQPCSSISAAAPHASNQSPKDRICLNSPQIAAKMPVMKMSEAQISRRDAAVGMFGAGVAALLMSSNTPAAIALSREQIEERAANRKRLKEEVRNKSKKESMESKAENKES